MRRWTVLRIVGLAGLALLVGWLLWPAALAVEIVQVERALLVERIEEDGEVRAHDRYVVAAPVAGRLRRISLHPADRVEAGAELAVLDPLPLSSRQTQQAQAQLQAAQARAEQARELAAALLTRQQQAAREAQRLQQLSKQAAVSAQSLDAAVSSATALGLELDAARAAERAARAEIEVYRALLEPGDGPLPALRLAAPVAATVLRVHESSERVVEAGTALLSLGDPSRMEVVIDLLSSDAVKVQPGMPVLLDNWGGGHTLQAQVRTVEPSAYLKVSPLGVEERRVDVIADLADPPAALGDGYQVEAGIVLWQGDVLQLPSSAVFRSEDGWAVYRLDGGRARQQAVQIGHRGRDAVEIVSGLQAGDPVLRFPGDQVQAGQRVRALR